MIKYEIVNVEEIKAGIQVAAQDMLEFCCFDQGLKNSPKIEWFSEIKDEKLRYSGETFERLEPIRGLAYPTMNLIRLSADYQGIELVKHTVSHECRHMAQYEAYGTKIPAGFDEENDADSYAQEALRAVANWYTNPSMALQSTNKLTPQNTQPKVQMLNTISNKTMDTMDNSFVNHCQHVGCNTKVSGKKFCPVHTEMERQRFEGVRRNYSKDPR